MHKVTGKEIPIKRNNMPSHGSGQRCYFHKEALLHIRGQHQCSDLVQSCSIKSLKDGHRNTKEGHDLHYEI